MRRIPAFCAFIALLLAALPCLGETALTARYDSDSSYSLIVTGLNEAVQVEISVGYDSNLLANPVVTKTRFTSRAQVGSVNEKGLVKITVTRSISWPLAGSDSLATLTFSKVGDLPGKLTFITASFQDREGRQRSVDASIVNPPDAPDQRAGANKPADANRGTPSAGAIAPRADFSTAVAASAPLPRVETATDTGRIPATGTVLKISSVLDRFRDSAGTNDYVALKQLFVRSDTAGIRQEPAIALSDGITPVTVTLPQNDSQRAGVTSFILSGMQLTRLTVTDNGMWSLTLLPEKGNYTARLTIVSDVSLVEFPLTVAPRDDQCPASCLGYLRKYIHVANCLTAPVAGAACPDTK